MKRSTDRILTTHVGSVGRPPELLELLQDRADGKPIDMDRFEELVRQSVKDVVNRQVATGIDVVNDGEQSKMACSSYLPERLTGLELIPPDERSGRSFPGEREDFPEFYDSPFIHATEKIRRTHRRALCTGSIGWKDFTEVQRDIDNLRSAVAGANCTEAFITSPTPSFAAVAQPNRYYSSDEEYMFALADALSREYKAITNAGFVLQVDMPVAGPRARSHKTEGDPYKAMRTRLKLQVDTLNHALENVPGDQVRLHVCYGSDQGPHHLDPDLKDTVDLLLSAKPHGITLVSSSSSHEHEYKLWERIDLPDEKVIIVGAIDHTSNIVEHPETVGDRIVRMANLVGREHVMAGVDCGFDPTAGAEFTRVDRRIMWAKLGSLVKGAELASKELWN